MTWRVLVSALLLVSSCGGGQSYDDGKDGVETKTPESESDAGGTPPSGAAGRSSTPADAVPSEAASAGNGGAGNGGAGSGGVGSGGGPSSSNAGASGGPSGGMGGVMGEGGSPLDGGTFEPEGDAGAAGAAGAGGAQTGGTGGALNDPCQGAVVDAACAEEGRSCSDCRDSCSFCWVMVCSQGVWNAFEAAPEPCFECGGDTCTALSEYCDVSAPDEPVCRALPTACSGNASCQCLLDAGLDVVSCSEEGGGVTAETAGSSACPTVIRSRSVYLPAETGCDPPCEGAETCHEVYQQQGPIPVQDVFECVDATTITGPSEMRDDTLSCGPDEVCLTYGEEVFTEETGEPRVDTYETGRCARVAECAQTPADCECLEQTCDEVFSDQGFAGECQQSPSGLECVVIAG